VGVNLVCRLCLGEAEHHQAGCHKHPMELMDAIFLLSLSYKVETVFDVLGLACELAVFDILLNCGIVVDYEDSTYH
jgi:hypothetical protein